MLPTIRHWSRLQIKIYIAIKMLRVWCYSKNCHALLGAFPIFGGKIAPKNTVSRWSFIFGIGFKDLHSIWTCNRIKFVCVQTGMQWILR